jgi:hypothetical protein
VSLRRPNCLLKFRARFGFDSTSHHPRPGDRRGGALHGEGAVLARLDVLDAVSGDGGASARERHVRYEPGTLGADCHEPTHALDGAVELPPHPATSVMSMSARLMLAD